MTLGSRGLEEGRVFRTAARATGWIGVGLAAAGFVAAVALARPDAYGRPAEAPAATPRRPLSPTPDKPPPTRPCPDPPCFDPAASRTPAAFLNWVARDVSTFWRVPRPGGRHRVAGRAAMIATGTGKSVPVRARPGSRTSAFGAFYCPRDRPPTVFLPAGSDPRLSSRTPGRGRTGGSGTSRSRTSWRTNGPIICRTS